MEQTQNITIRQANLDDIPTLWSLAAAMGAAKNDGYFDHAMEAQEAGTRRVFLVAVEGMDVGYCMLAWAPKYAFFRKMEIPEIQDLNVIPAYRRRGLGQAMIVYCEGLARDAGCEYMGIGVGMDASYGAAQRLYVRLGYAPDGNGLTYDRKVIAKGEFRPVDDDMSLMMIKDLQN